MRNPLRLAAVLFLSGMFTAAARGQFVGDFALPPLGGGYYVSPSTIGNWNFNCIYQGLGSSTLTTFLYPDAFTLESTAPKLTQSTNSVLTYANILHAGTISFTYDFRYAFGPEGGDGSANFTYGLNDSPVIITAARIDDVELSVQPGDSLVFSAFVQSGPQQIFAPELSYANVTVSNFSFTPTVGLPIPEPADFAFGAGGFSLMLAAGCRRLRRGSL